MRVEQGWAGAVLPLRRSEDTAQEHREAAEVAPGLGPSHLEGTSCNRHQHVSCSNHLPLPSLHPSCPSSSGWHHCFQKLKPVKKYSKTRVKNQPNPRGRGRKGRARAAVPSEAAEELWDGSEPNFASTRGTSPKAAQVFPPEELWREELWRFAGEFRLPGYQQGRESLTSLFLPQFLSAPMEGKGRGMGLWKNLAPRLEGGSESPGVSLWAPVSCP